MREGIVSTVRRFNEVRDCIWRKICWQILLRNCTSCPWSARHLSNPTAGRRPGSKTAKTQRVSIFTAILENKHFNTTQKTVAVSEVKVAKADMQGRPGILLRFLKSIAGSKLVVDLIVEVFSGLEEKGLSRFGTHYCRSSQEFIASEALFWFCLRSRDSTYSSSIVVLW